MFVFVALQRKPQAKPYIDRIVLALFARPDLLEDLKLHETHAFRAVIKDGPVPDDRAKRLQASIETVLGPAFEQNGLVRWAEVIVHTPQMPRPTAPISALGLSIRVHGILQSAGKTTILSLINTPEKNLRALHGIGKGDYYFNEIAQKLHAAGYRLIS